MAISIDPPWWEKDPDEMGTDVARIIDGLKRDQAGRRARYMRNLSLYEGRRMAGYSAYSYANYTDDSVAGEYDFEDDRLSLVRAGVSTAVAEIYGRQKPKPQFQTLGATWAVRRKAYKLDRICEGILNQRQGRFVNMWAFMRDAGTEAALQGMAAIKVEADREAKRIVHRLIPAPDVFVDPAEGREPMCYFYREPIDEHRALEQFVGSGKRAGAVEQAIRGAAPYDWYGLPSSTMRRAVRTIELRYAYRLPLGKDKPGHWCALIDDFVVDEGPWTAPAPPFVFLPWEYHRAGFWASGIGDEGCRSAREVSELDERLMIRHLIATGNYVFYPDGSLQSPRELEGNDPVRMVPYTGAQPPTHVQRQPFSPTELEHLREKKANFWDTIGVSGMSAGARREPGVQSAIGQITVNEIKAGRQIVKAERYEQAFVDLAHQWVWRLRELKEEDPELVVEWSGHALLQRIKFSDADPEDDAEMTVSVAPASAMPHDPAGRQELADILFRQGVISQERYTQLLGWADIDDAVGGERAEQEYIDSLIDRYLDAQEESWDATQYQAPEGFIMDKLGAIRRFSNAWFKARLDQMTLDDEEKAKAEFSIGLLTRWIQEMDALMQPPEVPAPDVAAAATGVVPDQLPQLPAPPAPGPQPLPVAG